MAADAAFERVRGVAGVGPLRLLAILAPIFLAPLGFSRIDHLDELLDDRHRPKASTPFGGRSRPPQLALDRLEDFEQAQRLPSSISISGSAADPFLGRPAIAPRKYISKVSS